MQKIFLFLLILTMATGLVYGSPKLKPVTPPPAPPSSEELVALLPQSDYLVLMDAQQIIKKVYAELSDSKKDTKSDLMIAKTLNDIEASALKYGIDIHQFKQIAFAGKFKNNEDFCFVASGKFNPDALIAAIIANSPSGAESVGTDTYQNTKLYFEKSAATNENHRAGLAFIGNDIMIVGNLEMVKKVLDVRAGQTPGLLTNAEMNNYYSILNEHAAFRFVAFMPEMKTAESVKKPESIVQPEQQTEAAVQPEQQTEATVQEKQEAQSELQANQQQNQAFTESMKNLEKLFYTINAVYGSIDISKGCDLDGALVTKMENDAKEISQSLSGLIFLGKIALAEAKPDEAAYDKQLKKKISELLDMVIINQVDKEVRINVNISDQFIVGVTNLINEINEINKPKSTTESTVKQ